MRLFSPWCITPAWGSRRQPHMNGHTRSDLWAEWVFTSTAVSCTWWVTERRKRNLWNAQESSWEASSLSLAAAGSYPVEQSSPALCSACCCEMMLMVIKLYGPFFKGSCSPDLLAKITVSVRDAGKQSGFWQPICASVGGNSRYQMDASAVSGVRCNNTVGCQLSR